MNAYGKQRDLTGVGQCRDAYDTILADNIRKDPNK